MKIVRLLLISIVLLAAAAAGFVLAKRWQDQQAITDFESCAAAGNPIRESYPAVCVTPDGKTYNQPVSAE